MCKFIRPCNKKRMVGYKVIVVDNVTGKYFSPVIGMQYKFPAGYIPTPKKRTILLSGFSDVLDKKSYAYIEKYKGYTGAFINKEDAEYYAKRYSERVVSSVFTPMVVKVYLSKDLYYGMYGFKDVILGKYMQFFKYEHKQIKKSLGVKL